jgi:hypothetical protein
MPPRRPRQDLPRTFPRNAWVSSPEGLQALRDVLIAYSAHNREVGYCQVSARGGPRGQRRLRGPLARRGAPRSWRPHCPTSLFGAWPTGAAAPAPAA